MQRQTKISIWCERLIEAGWLLILTLIPIYFNLLSARHFEPDKATTLRSIVLLMAAFAIIHMLEKINAGASSRSTAPPKNAPPESVPTNPFGNVWKQLTRVPMTIPVLIYCVVFIISTITSVVPYTSLWGSYQRLQGTYTNLSYVALFGMIILIMRRREQLERLITVTLITSLMVSFYGVVQHAGFDPLPWKGDVTQRVASTMGNAIFVAAYLIMAVPFALYRIINGVSEVRKSPSSSNPMADILWALAYVILILGTMTMLVSAIKFGSVVRVADFRYWWVFPGAIVVSTALWTLPTFRLQYREQNKKIPLWPGITFAIYLLLLGPMFLISSGSDRQQIDPNMAQGMQWWVWLLISVVAVVIFYVMAYNLPRTPSGEPSRMAQVLRIIGSALILLSMLTTIIFSQSRGPWLGIGAGLFVFLTLFIWLAGRRVSQSNPGSGLAKTLRIALVGWGIAAIAGIAFIVTFNLSDAPFFNDLRQVPYVGRLGTMLKGQGQGTGEVRRLIWTGDDNAGGTIELIMSDPFRTAVGWGPESMFVAFNPFYPPSLANIESRTASPDRAHQAVLDELATKGMLGLISYFFVLISFASLAWHIIRRTTEWRWQVLAIACFSTVAAHFTEGMTGIPIVSTLTMLWTTFGVTLVVGLFAGHYTLPGTDYAPVVNELTTPKGIETEKETKELQEDESDALKTETDEQQAATTTQPVSAQKGKQKSKKSKGRGTAPAGKQQGKATQTAAATTQNRGGRRSTASSGRATGEQRRQSTSPVSRANATTNPPALAFYALVLLMTFGAIWWFNISTVYADMRFHEGETYSNQPNAGLNEHIFGLHKYLDALRHNPREDFYYLNLGRSLMNIAEDRRASGVPMGKENSEVQVEDMLQYDDITEVAGFVQAHSPLELMSYARAVLVRARDLNPLNKDHYANLARINNFWYNWTQGIEKLETSADWYERANEVAPYDVALINESAGIHMMLGSIFANMGDSEKSQQYIARAEELYQTSLSYDPKYGEADVRLAELYQQQGRLEDAADMYAQAIERRPDQFNGQTETIATVFEQKPDLLKKIRDAYNAKAGKNAQLHAIAGLLSVRAGDMEGAAEAYEQAVTLNPNDAGARRNYTIILSDTEQYAEALTQATAALSLTQQQEDVNQTDIAQLEYLISILEEKNK